MNHGAINLPVRSVELIEILLIEVETTLRMLEKDRNELLDRHISLTNRIDTLKDDILALKYAIDRAKG